MNMSPQPLPPPPRRVRGQLGGSLWFTRIFILPHTLIGIGAIIYWLLLILSVLFGRDIPSTVTGTDISHSRKSGDHYSLIYQFPVGDVVKTNSGSVSQGIYQRYKIPNATNPPVTVHYFSLGIWDHAQLRESGSLWSMIGFLTLWAGFWNFVVGIFAYQIWIKPLRARWLYKHGETTSGTVLSKRVRTGKSSTYYVTYRFREPYSGQEFETEMQVWNKTTWITIRDGQTVTVLYAREKPKRSTVYECGGYQVSNVRMN